MCVCNCVHISVYLCEHVREHVRVLPSVVCCLGDGGVTPQPALRGRRVARHLAARTYLLGNRLRAPAGALPR